jgi:hypothetical protein
VGTTQNRIPCKFAAETGGLGTPIQFLVVVGKSRGSGPRFVPVIEAAL